MQKAKKHKDSDGNTNDKSGSVKKRKRKSVAGLAKVYLLLQSLPCPINIKTVIVGYNFFYHAMVFSCNAIQRKPTPQTWLAKEYKSGGLWIKRESLSIFFCYMLYCH